MSPVSKSPAGNELFEPCDPSCEELDASKPAGLEVFGETAVATEPGKGALTLKPVRRFAFVHWVVADARERGRLCDRSRAYQYSDFKVGHFQFSKVHREFQDRGAGPSFAGVPAVCMAAGRSRPTLRLGKIACIAQPLALIFGSSGLGPHLVPPSLFIVCGFVETQVTDSTQLFFGRTLSSWSLYCLRFCTGLSPTPRARPIM